MPKKTIFLTLAILLALALFLRYGRSIYMPLLNRFRAKETVASIAEKQGEAVRARLQPALQQAGLASYPEKLLLLGLKEERLLEVYAEDNGKFILLKTYPFTAFSGKIGPKLREGDRQIPEGIYQVEYLNPNSSYYLSMKVSYPNAFDLEKAKSDGRQQLGGDIFIHGKNATIGCIPLGDEGIEEVFLLVANAMNKGVSVIISPRDFRKGLAYPDIPGIAWEKALYQQIEAALARI